ncbi:MAG: hypothetical protein SV186_00945 [Candidatus Nanohaloarchaea archaeon]|nr:hypothetical protein [Candidatus Nanohaloarchaea archaeon]
MTVRSICSEDEATFLDRDETAVALDIETMDDLDEGIDDAPVLGYALTRFDPGALDDTMQTLVRLVDDLREEDELLQRLFEDLRSFGDVTVTGHNVAFPDGFEHLDADGYDLPKLEARAAVHGIDASFLHDLATFDTMDVAGGHYRHSEDGTGRWMGLDELTDRFGIEPPAKFITLGPDIRKLWRRDAFDRIMLYNAANAMVVARLVSIFRHQLDGCPGPDGSIGEELCEHVHGLTPIRELPAWNRLKGQTSFAGSDV